MGSDVNAEPEVLTPELLGRLSRGEEEAWYSFVSAYEGRLYGYLYRLEGNSEDALDLIHDVFYRSWRSIYIFLDGERSLPVLF